MKDVASLTYAVTELSAGAARKKEANMPNSNLIRADMNGTDRNIGIISYLASMKRIMSVAAALILTLFFPLLCFSQSDATREELELRSGRRVMPSLRAVLPFYAGVSALADSLSGKTMGFNFGMEIVGMRLSAKSSPLEANIGLRWSVMNFQQGSRVFHLGAPVRIACKFADRGKVYAGASADLRVGGDRDASPFVASVEGGISYYGFGLRASYSFNPVVPGGRALCFGVVVGL